MIGLPQKQRFCGRRRSDSPPPLESLSPPAKAGGLRAPALDPAPRGVGRGCVLLLFPQTPDQRQRKEKGGAFWFVPSLHALATWHTTNL